MGRFLRHAVGYIVDSSQLRSISSNKYAAFLCFITHNTVYIIYDSLYFCSLMHSSPMSVACVIHLLFLSIRLLHDYYSYRMCEFNAKASDFIAGSAREYSE